MDSKPTCETCKYRDGRECRRNAPVPFNTEYPLYRSKWPEITESHDWCGEYSKKVCSKCHGVGLIVSKDERCALTECRLCGGMGLPNED